MKTFQSQALFFLILILLLAAACSPQPSLPTLGPEEDKPTVEETPTVEATPTAELPSPTPEPTEIPSPTSLPSDQPCPITDFSMGMAEAQISYEEYALHHYTLSDDHVLAVWYVDPEINEAQGNALVQAKRNAAEQAFYLFNADECIRQSITAVSVVVVDANYNTWLSGDINADNIPVGNAPSPNQINAMVRDFNIFYSAQLPLPEYGSASGDACTFAEAKENILTHFAAERTNTAFYYDVRPSGANLWAQWDGPVDPVFLMVNMLNIFLELECLYPEPSNIIFIVVDETGKTGIIGLIPNGENGFSMDDLSIMYRGAVGEAVGAESGIHVDLGTELIYLTSPPNSGMHFGSPMSAGFYDNTDPSVQSIEQPEGHIVHSLEHGYVAVWYNCTGMSDLECENLKEDIRRVVEADPDKVIVFPWTDMEEPITLTSWGQILRLENFDGDLIAEFISTNRSHPRAPEPNVP